VGEERHYNAAGTHVWVVYPNGSRWECPANDSSIAYALARGAEFCEPAEDNDALLYDPEVLAARQEKPAEKPAEKKPAKKAASKRTTPGD
jgi:hypothetical protein